MKEPKLGDRVKDKITGFTGIVTSEINHLTGCKRFVVAGEKLNEGIPTDPQVFDEHMVEVVKPDVVVPQFAEVTGGPIVRLPRKAKQLTPLL